MRTHLAAALAASLLFSGSAVTFAAQSHKPAATHNAAEKTATGTVKSIDASKLVLKTKKGDMTFSLGSAKVDNISTGASVQVHYKTQGKDHVATSVMPASTSTAKK
jgi:hypothetical protein